MNRKAIAIKCLKATFIGLVLLLMYAPILLLTVYSFIDTDIIGTSGKISLVHYRALFTDPKVLTMIGNTFGLALALAITFVAFGLPKSYFTLLIGHMVICTPFVVLSVMPKLKQMDNSLYEAALDLGASPAKALFTVVLPQIIPGVISGFMLAITLSLDDYIVTFYTRPSGFETISTYVFNATTRGNAHTAATLSSFWALTTIIFVVILIVVISANLVGRKKEVRK